MWRNALWKWRCVPNREKKIAYVAGGTTIAVFGLLSVDGNRVKEPADAHDVKALSRIPLGKLFTGWV